MDLKQEYLKNDPKLHTLTMKCLFRRRESLEELHPAQMGLLMTLFEEGCCNQRTLVKKLHCSAASVATSIKRLEKSGYVKKEDDPEDQRSTRIALTDLGKNLALESIHQIDEFGDVQLKGFSEEELRQLVDFQNRIIYNMKEFLMESEKKGE